MHARNRSSILAATALGVATLGLSSLASADILLNDTFADGNRNTTSLPSDSPVHIGISAGNGSASVSPGSLDYIVSTSSMKQWTYFTRNGSAPDGNQPHNSVTQLAVGDKLKTQMSFSLPLGATSTSTSKSFRMGVFLDPTDARVQIDTNSDAGGGTSPWQDALGYAVQIPLNSNTTNANPFQIGKRTSNANTSLLGSNNSYTNAPTGGTAYSIAANTTYTLELLLDVISGSQLDVTASLKQGNTVLSSQTVSDTGSAFGGTAIVGALPGNNAIYTNFDQIFFRNSDASQVVTNGTPPGDTVNLKITNLYAEIIQVPEPGTAALAVVGLTGLAARRRRVS